MTDQRCLTSAIARRSALTARPSSSSAMLVILSSTYNWIYIEVWKTIWFKRHLRRYWVIYIFGIGEFFSNMICITQYHPRFRLNQIAFYPRYNNIIIIINSKPQSTAGYRPLQLIAMLLDWLLASSSWQPSYANRHSPGLRASNANFTEARSPFQNSFSPTVVGSTSDMASPLPLQRVNTVSYVSDFISLPDHLIPGSIPRNPEHSSFLSSLSDLERVGHTILHSLYYYYHNIKPKD
jgi:hypothetical protein